MPKRTDIEKILIIGSGPIVIGQACEFDYSGVQAIKALKKEGYKVILVNSNPATIMTDPEFADSTYIEPLASEIIEKIIEKEKPDAILPTLGGQTALNLACELAEKGILQKHNVELIGADFETISKAEDRKLFKKMMMSIGLDLPKSGYAYSLEEAVKISQEIDFPLIVRPSFTLGGVGSGTAFTKEEFIEIVTSGLQASPIKEVLIEESVLGWKELEMEVMRDAKDNCIAICSIENFDPMGVHTGDSITVAPAMTLTAKEYSKMREDSFRILRIIGMKTGGANIQFAQNPKDGRMVVIEMNPRVSRSSALASKATGFPIAKISTLLAIGYNLDEIKNDITSPNPASFEPTVDYHVVKVPRFAFEKFSDTNQTLGTAMKSVGETMALGRTFKEAIQKAIRGLEVGRSGYGLDKTALDISFEKLINENTDESLKKAKDLVRAKLGTPNCDRLYVIRFAFKLDMTIDEIFEISKIDPWFLNQLKEIVEAEKEIPEIFNLDGENQKQLLKKIKEYGFSDKQIAFATGKTPEEIRTFRKSLNVVPVYKLVDTCAGEFKANTAYYYSTYEQEDDVPVTKNKKKIMILGAGPNRIGQGIEFDYCCVHAVFALKEEGYETIMVNSNPETVSTDFDTADKLYFEPLTTEDVLNIAEKEGIEGVVVQFGGQTPLNLASSLNKAGIKIMGTSVESIDMAEDRKIFSKILNKINIPQAESGTAVSFEEAKEIAKQISYPVMVRPSYVLGGRAMKVVYDETELKEYITLASDVTEGKPILIDKFLDNAIEIDVDALSDGKDVYIAGIMEHIEEAGIHSGDSACVLPTHTLKKEIITQIKKYTIDLAREINVKGLINIQFAVKDGVVYILEANPRASRTVPFVSKAMGIPLAKLASKIMTGKKLSSLIPEDLLNGQLKHIDYYCVKEVVLPWIRFSNVDTVLGPEMKSTGEVMGIDKDYGQAYAKASLAAATRFPDKGTVLISLGERSKSKALQIARDFISLGFDILATKHTAEYFIKNQIAAKEVHKIEEGRPNVTDVIKNKDVCLIINTPSGSKSRKDGYQIRRTAVMHGVPILTTLAAAVAAVEAIKSRKQMDWSVCPIQEYYKK
ncbi:MAG: carbamoyl-phosphate synthase large subunit [Endomicrobiaceae bacterium]|jgi:carbamoyl-phosphate synthase large subunit|nr:carbamoyl-phosphate synthase large subunit [Endomicrobiaceae bacterium]MDD3729563.1 carbamoyl-phosphate synthase large subunit [Endomicrobiaceae bacterium]MDD4165645.1 carbamoyl-phosphate synthase large subunit [Endomicrobiaceae bacterium]